MNRLQIIGYSAALLSICAFAAFAGEQATKDTCIHHGIKDTCVQHAANHPCVHHSAKDTCMHASVKHTCANHDAKSTCVHEASSNKQSVDEMNYTKNVVPKSPDKQILFFMNPNGHPCQMQLSILDNMKTKLSGLATVTYIKTTEHSDENKFYQYGIRGLPSLIIADKNGKEIKRLPPGIKDENAILAALKD